MSELESRIQEWETIKHAASKSELQPTLHSISFDTPKQTLVLMGDTHIGSKYYKEEKHRKDLGWCVDNDIPIILMGDNIECATRDSVGAGVYESDEIVDEQIEHWLNIYKDAFAKGLVLGTHDGNHEARVYKSSGIHLTKHMAKEAGIKYFGWSKLHKIRVGNQNYIMYTTHGASGARMPHTKIKAAINLNQIAEADIYAMGHLHQLSHHTKERYRVNTRNKTVEKGETHFLITGGYLGHWGSYGHIAGMEPTKAGSPKIKLSGEEHQIRVSL